MSNFVEYITTEKDITIRVYGWPIDHTRTSQTVFLGFDYSPFSASTTMSPTEARKLADSLLKAAYEAERAPVQAAA
jgi:hypothetical protein